MLKTVENLGVSYMKGTEQYQSKLEAELRKLKFSYRVSKRGTEMFLQFVCVLVVTIGRSCIMHRALKKLPEGTYRPRGMIDIQSNSSVAGCLHLRNVNMRDLMIPWCI